MEFIYYNIFIIINFIFWSVFLTNNTYIHDILIDYDIKKIFYINDKIYIIENLKIKIFLYNKYGIII